MLHVQIGNKNLKEVRTEYGNLLVLDESLMHQSAHVSQEKVSGLFSQCAWEFCV